MSTLSFTEIKPPSILLITVPKSGTVYTKTMLARGLNIPEVPISLGYFPRALVDWRQLSKFAACGSVCAEHLDASAENLQILEKYLDRWVVHVRDPRSVLVSWVHHVDRYHNDGPEALLQVCPTPPEDYFKRPFSQKLDWNIQNFLPEVVSWMSRWNQIIDSGVYNILNTRFDQLVEDEGRFIHDILAFYNTPGSRFVTPKIVKNMEEVHFRAGGKYEWQSALSQPQLKTANQIIGPELLDRYRWPTSGEIGFSARRRNRSFRRMESTNEDPGGLSARFEAASAEVAALRERIAEVERSRVDLAHQARLTEGYIAAWRSDEAVRPVDQNPISLLRSHPEAGGFYGCCWGPVERYVDSYKFEDSWFRPLGAGGVGILLHRTTERTGFVIEISGRVFGERDLRTLLVSINDQAPNGRDDSFDGRDFTITLSISIERIVIAAGRLVIRITDTAYQPNQNSGRFGFTEYRIRPAGSATAEQAEPLTGDAHGNDPTAAELANTKMAASLEPSVELERSPISPAGNTESSWNAQQRQVFETLYLSVQYVYGMQVEGDIVEFGTMSGDTAAVLAEAIAACDRLLAPRYGPIHGAPKTLWLFDSFAGLPEPQAEPDRTAPHVVAGVWTAASCKGISPESLALRLSEHLPACQFRIIEGWYADTVTQLPDHTRFACIHVDCDLYASTLDALAPLFARGQVADGAVILFDDWNCNKASPLYGERKAWEELVARHRICFSDEGRYGMASRRFIVHSYQSGLMPETSEESDCLEPGGATTDAEAASIEMAGLRASLDEAERQLAERAAAAEAASAQITTLFASLGAARQLIAERAAVAEAASAEIADLRVALAEAERRGVDRAAAAEAALSELANLGSVLGEAEQEITKRGAAADVALAEMAALRAALAEVERGRAELAAQAAASHAYIEAWRSDDGVRPVDENPISLVPPSPDPHGFRGCLWGPVETDVDKCGDTPCLMLGPSGAGILLHRTTVRTGFVIELGGRVFGDRDPQELFVSINNQAPTERNDDFDGQNFRIALRISHDRVAAAAGRLVIKIADPTHQLGRSNSDFGFAEYRIRPNEPETKSDQGEGRDEGHAAAFAETRGLRKVAQGSRPLLRRLYARRHRERSDARVG